MERLELINRLSGTDDEEVHSVRYHNSAKLANLRRGRVNWDFEADINVVHFENVSSPKNRFWDSIKHQKARTYLLLHLQTLKLQRRVSIIRVIFC